MLVNGIKITTAIFDWSGTLSDDRLMVYEANLLIRRQHGLPPIDFETFLAEIKLTAAEAFTAMGISGTKEELQAMYTKAVAHVKELGVHPTAYPDVEDVLGHLTSVGVRTAVLSSHPDEHVRSEAQAFGLGHHFHLIAGDCHDKRTGIWEILEQLGIDDRTSVIYIGDTVYDIRAAKLAGVASAGVATGYMNSVRLMMEEPDKLFYSLTDLAKQY